MNFEIVKVSKLKSNPENPRVIKDVKFERLVQSILAFPKMLEIRPIVVNADFMVLGGNMRLKAVKHLGLKEVPVICVDDLTDEQQRQFIIKDNANFGEWNMEQLANEWDSNDLIAWGVDLYLPETVEEFPDEEERFQNPTITLSFTDPEQLQKAEIDMQEILDRKYKGATLKVKL